MSATAFLVRQVVRPASRLSRTLPIQSRVYSSLSETLSGKESHVLTRPLASFDLVKTLGKSFYLHTPEEDEIPLRAGQRLVCVGDVHGDYNALCRFLRIAGVMEEDGERWCGGDTVLVQCGDVLDRGSRELDCFGLLARLSQQAALDDGHVVVLWGNHEALNALGDFRYTTGDQEYREKIGTVVDQAVDSQYWRAQFAANQPSRWATYEPGGILAEPLLQHLKVAVKVGNTVCVHAGLTKQHLDQNGGLSGMNQSARDWILNAQHKGFNNLGMYHSTQEAVKAASKRIDDAYATVPSCFMGGIGDTTPIWMRDYSLPRVVDSPKALGMIRLVLQELGADRCVMGHTVQDQGINSALYGMAWRIDVGASSGVANGTPEVLEITKTENGEEIVSVLTTTGKYSSKERQSIESLL